MESALYRNQELADLNPELMREPLEFAEPSVANDN